MKGINKAACRSYLEPLTPPNSDCGLFLIKKLKFIVRTTIKNIGHRRMLVLCLYARGNTPGGKPVLAFTMFQASDSFITFDHSPSAKGPWRTAMLGNLDRSYHFIPDECAFYSGPDEKRVFEFCRPYVSGVNNDSGFDALDDLQKKIRGKETRRRQRNRELAVRRRMKTLRSLPKDTENWIVRRVVPAYFFYDYRKGKNVVKGVCTACGGEVELENVHHNAKCVCPLCGRSLVMKANGKRGRIWNRSTASIVQKINRNEVVIRVLKAYSEWSKAKPQWLKWYEETRIFLSIREDGIVQEEAYHDSGESVGVTPWKRGYPPECYLYGSNFNAETCGALYLRTLDRELAGTAWQYCQLGAFYRGVKYEELEVKPYLKAYPRHARLEHLVKLGFYELASDLVYRDDYNHTLDESKNRTHQILRVSAEDVPFLRDMDVTMAALRKYQEYCKANLKDRQRLLLWQLKNQVEYELPKLLEYSTPHKIMRFLDEQYPALRTRKTGGGMARYSNMQDVVREYRDYLETCVKLRYDMRNSFVLFPKDLQIAHDKAARRLQQKADAKMRREFKEAYRRIMSRLDFELDGMKIIYPSTPEDITAEGNALHHCVGSYIDRVAKQECIILFLRKCDDETKPFYTIEVRHKQVMQVRGMKNEDATPEVKKFMSQWEKQVLQRSHMPKAA